MNNKEQQVLLEFEEIKRLVRMFSIPATIALIINALYNVVDAVFIGKATGTAGIAALGIVFPIQVLIIALAQLIGIGAGSMTSRFLGAGNSKKVKQTMGNAMTAMMIISLAVSILGIKYMDSILTVLGANEAILDYAKSYLTIILYGTVTATFSSVMIALLRAMGSVQKAVMVMMAAAVLNIILDPIFIFGLDLGVEGAAYATVLAQVFSFLALVVLGFVKTDALHIGFSDLVPRVKLLTQMLGIGFSSFFRLIVGSGIAVVVNQTLGAYGGTLAISLYGAIGRLVTFTLMPVHGTVQGVQPIIGFNFGSHMYQRVAETIRVSSMSVFKFTMGLLVVMQLLAGVILRIFSSDPVFLSEGAVALRIIFMVIPIAAYQMLASGIFQALGKAMPALILAVIRQLILIPLILYLPTLGSLGILGVWISFPLADVIAGTITIILMKREVDGLSKVATA